MPTVDRTPYHRAAGSQRHPFLLALVAGAVGVLLAQWPERASAQTTQAVEQSFDIDLPAQALAQALAALSRQTGVQVFAGGELVSGLAAPAVRGRLSAKQALDQLLAGSGLVGVAEGSTWIVGPAPASAPAVASDLVLPAVTVSATAEPLPGGPPKPYAGGMVADGQRLGVLGDRGRMDTPVSTQSYTRDLLRNQQARELADVLANDPSTISAGTRYQAFTTAVSRGIYIPAEGFLFNGVSNLLPSRNPSLVGIERVEVLRGPSALFSGAASTFGSGAGGTINLVPSRATDKPINEITFGYQSDSTLYTLIDLGRRYGQDNEWGVRLGAELRDGKSPIRFNEEFRGAVALGVDYRGERLRASFDLVHQDTKADANTREFYSVAGPVLPAPPQPGFNSQQPWAREYFKSTIGLLRVEYDVAPTTTMFASFGYSREPSSGAVSSPGNLQPSGDWDIFSYSFVQEDERLNVEGGVRSRFSTGPVMHNAVAAYSAGWSKRVLGFVGSGGFTNNLDDFRPIFAPPDGPFPAASFPDRRAYFSGLTLADTLSILDDRAQLTLGVRRQQIRITPYDGTTGARTSDPEYDEARWSPGVGLVVRPATWLSLYGNYLEALAPGGTAPLTAANSGTALAPIVSKQVESGAKFDFGQVGGSIAMFQIKEPRAGTDPVTNFYGQVGEARIRGIEGTVFGEPRRGLRLLTGLTLLQPVYSKSDTPAAVGKDVQGTPRLRLVANGEYDLPAVQGLTLTGRLTHFGRAYAGLGNTIDIPSWTRLDLGLRQTFTVNKTPLTAKFSVENVTNERYWVGDNFGAVAWATPRTYLLSLTASF